MIITRDETGEITLWPDHARIYKSDAGKWYTRAQTRCRIFRDEPNDLRLFEELFGFKPQYGSRQSVKVLR
jgi:hypothetical protein